MDTSASTTLRQCRYPRVLGGQWPVLNGSRESSNEYKAGCEYSRERTTYAWSVVGDVSISVGATPLPQLVSPEEAAKYLRVSAYTIRERLKRGEIPGSKHGARWLIRVVDLDKYVEPNNTT